MQLLMLSVFAVTALAAPQGYTLQEPGGPSFSVNEGPGLHVGSADRVSLGVSSGADSVGISPSTDVSTGVSLITKPGFSTNNDRTSGISPTETGVLSDTDLSIGSGIAINFDTECQEGEIRHVDGSCVVPEITRKVFVFSVPKQEREPTDSTVDLPPPKVEHNILFVRLPEGGVGPEPIVVPPPRQENIIYVLNKQGEQGQRVIEVPAHPPSEPEVYFVNYEEGENPTLPGGLDLQTALGSAADATGQFIGNAAIGSDDGLDTTASSEQIFSQIGSGQFSTGTGINVGTDINVKNNKPNEGFVAVLGGSQIDSDVADIANREITSGLYSIP
ncbi:uncharacterized protein LOC125037990 [Penaeus chinensis]|uniref:uncharacterized protein LOC125037990 n=1 Tax=Penaeus chinensis TaxID=139456 RepID=UPI001FB783B4|nr:uncharacterized protein LOC125037990 [Penaeus chinensis]